ncbi:MAG: right-handed parallel beta-helix repeat-containing protein [Chthoniobacteraceae bacterium]
MKPHPHSIEILEARIAPSVFVVTSLADPAEAGKVTLRDALLMADNNDGLDTITFKLPAPPPQGANIIKLTAGQLTSMGSVTIKGPGPSKLILDGNDASTILRIDDADPTTDGPATIGGLSFAHGKGSDGGGIFSRESLTLRSVVIAGNSATGDGGGLTVLGALTAGAAPIKASISNSLITGNSAESDGGGMALVNLSAISIKKSVITGNSAPDGAGGGFYARLTATGVGLAISGCTISGNAADRGGGMFVENDNLNPAAKSTLSSTKVTGNRSFGTGEGGGGIYLSRGHAIISGSTIRNNTAVFNGGGIEARNVASLTISKSIISGNQTTTQVPYSPSGSNYDVGGGGLLIKGTGSSIAPVKIIGSRFIENSSQQDGGGVLAQDGIALTISGSTFAGNHARSAGGGVAAQGVGAEEVDLTVTGGTFADNIGGGISAFGSGVMSITGAKVTGNIGIGISAGIGILGGSGSVTIKNSIVSGNIGSGIGLFGMPDFKIIGGAIKGNVSSFSGGGIFAYDANGSITGVTISGNVAARSGGGIENTGNGTSGIITVQIAKVRANIAPVDPNISGPPGSIIFV